MSTLHQWTPWHIGSGQARVFGVGEEMEGGCLSPWLPCGVVQDGCALLPKVLLAGTHCAPPFLEVVTTLSTCSVKGRGTAPSLAWGVEGGREAEEGMGYFCFLATIFFEIALLLISSQL